MIIKSRNFITTYQKRQYNSCYKMPPLFQSYKNHLEITNLSLVSCFWFFSIFFPFLLGLSESLSILDGMLSNSRIFIKANYFIEHVKSFNYYQKHLNDIYIGKINTYVIHDEKRISETQFIEKNSFILLELCYYSMYYKIKYVSTSPLQILYDF